MPPPERYDTRVPRAHLTNAHVYVAIAVVVAGVWAISACSNDASSTPNDQASSSGGSSGGSSSGGSSGTASSSGTTETDGGTSSGTVPGATEPNLKIAFIGDTAAGSDFKSVLALIRQEKAAAVFIQGDLTYGGDNAADWFPAIDNEINKEWTGSTAPVTIPYFVSRGNHDSDWGNLGSGLKARMAKWAVPLDTDDPTKINYSVVFKGLKVVMVAPDETSPVNRNTYVDQRLTDDKHIWKICSWHKNQRASNVGPKSDEMGWAIYETCRKHGAIVAQGHSHTYSRSKTLTADATQTVDPACSDPFALCVGPNKHFWFDSSLGGVDTRSLDNVASRPYWASTYTGNYGALFIEFNVDGDARKARGYFKTVGGVVIDPPAASGKTSFTITASP
jgi:hypothetical protein